MERSGVSWFIRATIFLPVFVAWTSNLNFLSGLIANQVEAATSTVSKVRRQSRRQYRLPEFEHVRSFDLVDKFTETYRRDADKIRTSLDAALKDARGHYHGPYRYRYRQYPKPTHYPPWYFNHAVMVSISTDAEIKEPRGPEGVIYAQEVYQAPHDLREQMRMHTPNHPKKSETANVLAQVLQQSET
ncbi:UNVERIFIED_CONTAM: hypothetical protein HHA_227590 [Hammondia hammondi]|eukprot:XP_008882114.1 hypothetical protein HHA_227590 [Hammondia hammondi]